MLLAIQLGMWRLHQPWLSPFPTRFTHATTDLTDRAPSPSPSLAWVVDTG